jgi:hypothetical protein
MDKLSDMLASTHWGGFAWASPTCKAALLRLALAFCTIGIAVLLLGCMP